MSVKLSRREFTKTSVLAALGLFTRCSVKNRFNIIIKNGTIIDGAGSKPLKQDIGISGNKISAIDNLKTATADIIIDANQLVVAPGFIDIHTHTDLELLVNPNAESKIHQGVTTEVSGNCGSSPFPLNDIDYQKLKIDSTEEYELDVDWRYLNGFLNILEEKKISLNYATFTGHGRLRSYVVGKNDVIPSQEQMEQMKQLLADSMEYGSLGLSTGLEYAPGSYAKTGELVELCKVVSQHNGIYATHIRNEDDTVEEAVEEALLICKKAGVSTQISHLKACNKANWHKVDNLLQMIHNAADSGLPVHADRYPYIAYGTGLSIFIPLWARQGTTEDIIDRLKDKSLLPQIKEYIESRGKRIGGWDRVVISFCFTDENKKWEGKSILECSDESGKAPVEFITDLLIREKFRASIVGFAMSEENLRKILTSPLSMIGSDGSAVAPYGKLAKGKPHPRYYGTFPRVLGKYGRDENFFDLVTAVKKMTSMPAAKLGLNERGVIKKGYYADITIFNPETVIDNATFTNPHQYPTGIDYVIVNGILTIKNGKHTGKLAGYVLRHV